MTRRYWMMLVLAAPLAAAATGWGREAAKPSGLRVVAELTDGSRLVGTPLEKSLRVKLDFMKADIPLEKIRQCDVRHQEERVILNLQNGDKLTGTLEMPQFQLETILGKLSPEFAQIDRLTFTTGENESSPAEAGTIAFGGLNWLPWRTCFEVRGDKLVTLPKARPGFNYGHNGSGRGPSVMSNIGNPNWKDYCLECEFCVTGVDPSFNPYRMPTDHHEGAIYFHVADAKESWNQCGSSLYALSMHPDGTWQLSAVYNAYCRVPLGYGNYANDGERELASGEGLHLDGEHGNKFRIEVRGQHIQIWKDGERIANVTDGQMSEPIKGQTLDHGGVGFMWGYDCMGWIRNFSLKTL